MGHTELSLSFRRAVDAYWSPADIAIQVLPTGELLHRQYARHTKQCLLIVRSSWACSAVRMQPRRALLLEWFGLQLRDRMIRGTMSDAIGSLRALKTIDFTATSSLALCLTNPYTICTC